MIGKLHAATIVGASAGVVVFAHMAATDTLTQISPEYHACQPKAPDGQRRTN